jgi:hypothetical protein
MRSVHTSMAALAACLLASPALADAPAAEWEQPEIVRQGAEPMHTTFDGFESRAGALSRDVGRSRYHLSLDGDWKFQLSATPETRPADFFRPDFDLSGWGTMKVPGILQAEGHGRPVFVGSGYPFPRNQPKIEHSVNEVGSYRRDFTVPSHFAGRRLLLTIGAAGAAYYVWVNGQRVGYSEDSKLPAEFDVTAYAHAGSNTVAIELYRFADGSYLEDQDFWRVNGIERSVTLYSAPPTHIRDLVVDAGLENAYRDGRLSVKVDLGGKPAAMRVRMAVLDGKRQVLTREMAGQGTLSLAATLSGMRRAGRGGSSFLRKLLGAVALPRHDGLYDVRNTAGRGAGDAVRGVPVRSAASCRCPCRRGLWSDCAPIADPVEAWRADRRGRDDGGADGAADAAGGRSAGPRSAASLAIVAARLQSGRADRRWRRTGVPLARDALQRVRATPLLRSLSPKQRRAAVTAAFRVTDRAVVGGRHVVLVDDVYTTGATAGACVRALLAAGRLRSRSCAGHV